MQRIELIEPISSGRFGTVYKARYQHLKQPVAIKILPKVRQDLDDYQNKAILNSEKSYAKLLCNGKCPYIVESLDVFEDMQHVYNVMELCDGTLENDIKHHLIHMNDFDTILQIIEQMTLALDYTHGHNLIHADVKPANILYHKATRTYKLSDFGSALHIGAYERPKFITPTYCAPELMVASSDVTQKIDVWSIGMIAYILTHMDAQEVGHLEYRDDLPSHIKSLISSMLDRNQYTRPDVRQMKMKIQSAKSI